MKGAMDSNSAAAATLDVAPLLAPVGNLICTRGLADLIVTA
jgi:hypothetical protein